MPSTRRRPASRHEPRRARGGRSLASVASPLRRVLATRERRSAGAFGASVLALCVVWLFGFSLHAPLSSTDIEVVKVSGVWRVFNRNIPGLISVTFLLGLATLTYLAVLWALRRGFSHSFAAAIAACVLAGLSLMPLMPLTSPDAVHLAADVRTFWLHQTYPASWSGRPSQIDDPIAKQVVRFYDRPSGYGPLAYAIGGAPLPFVGDGLRANIAGEKAVAGTFLVLTAVLAGFVARRLGQNPGLVTAAVGLNPLMLWEFPADGHNDSIMAAFGVASLLFVLSLGWRQRAGGVGLGIASTASKFGLAIAAPVVAAAWFPRLRLAIAAAVVVLGGLLAFFIASGQSFNMMAIGPAREIVNTTPWGVLWKAVGEDDTGRQFVIGLAWGLFLLGAGAILVRHRLSEPADVVAAVGLMLFLFAFIGSPGLLPWYQVWYLPFAILSGRRWLVVTALVFSIGGFAPILARNWLLPIERDMGINDPVEKTAVVLWLVTAVTAFVVWRADQARELAAERATSRRRPGIQRRPSRSRS